MCPLCISQVDHAKPIHSSEGTRLLPVPVSNARVNTLESEEPELGEGEGQQAVVENGPEAEEGGSAVAEAVPEVEEGGSAEEVHGV